MGRGRIREMGCCPAPVSSSLDFPGWAEPVRCRSSTERRRSADMEANPQAANSTCIQFGICLRFSLKTSLGCCAVKRGLELRDVCESGVVARRKTVWIGQGPRAGASEKLSDQLLKRVARTDAGVQRIKPEGAGGNDSDADGEQPVPGDESTFRLHVEIEAVFANLFEPRIEDDRLRSRRIVRRGYRFGR